MKHCPSCKTELLDKAKFCSSCGADVTKVEIIDTDLELLKKGLSPKIEILYKLDSGGMAGIYLGEQISLHRKVVIKLLHSQFSKDQRLVDNFFQEAKIAASLKHNHIIEIIDFGVVENRPYFVMEYGEKGSLAKELKQLAKENQKISPRQTLWYIQDILRALEYANSKNIKVHRDIKPDNILIRESGQAILSDFGISLRKDQAPEKEETIGSYPYMSPEQILSNQDIDTQSDIYSCGIMLFEMITGNLPFEGKDHAEWLQLHTKENIPRLTSFLTKKEISDIAELFLDIEIIQEIIDKSTAKDRNLRYKNPRDMIQDLKDLLKKKESFLSKENIQNRRTIYILTLAFTTVLLTVGYFSFKYYSQKNCQNCCLEGNCSTGVGRFRYESGDEYEGGFQKDKPSGNGVYYYANGDSYRGEFVEGRIEGDGEYFSPSKSERYIGKFLNGKPHGKGTFHFPNGAKFDGIFVDGEPNSGRGTYYTAEGDRYEGNQKNMLPHGKGILYYQDGAIYEGEFKNGQLHGKGVHTSKNGKITIGIWENGKLLSTKK